MIQTSRDYEIVVFNAALALPELERVAYLEKTCKGNVELYLRVVELLRVNDRAGAFLEHPATGAPLSPHNSAPAGLSTLKGPAVPNAFEPGERIGRYRILEQIGEGGCGAVYLAEQEQPVRRRVALKVIKPGMDTKAVLARFEAEKQALAMMDHPNIARLFDAGATESGRPFFVMELVRGTRITDYCDLHRLNIPARLHLFIEVCHAVQHAHQKGIIHRDLKPSNVLISLNAGAASAMPKVIDFGIAKATQGRLTDQTLFTAFEQFLGTPAYMSPEQSFLTSLDIDTRSDLYSLGVLLYELLVGRTPFDHQELLAGGMEQMRRVIGEKEPLRPSTRFGALTESGRAAVARDRRSEAAKLIHVVRGDLDCIVMKCLEKDRSRRYDAVNSLAIDLQRFLLNEPIVARPPAKWYRLQKLVRRHRLVFAAAAAVVVALWLGLGLFSWQFIEKSQAEAEQIRLRRAAQQAQAGEAQLRRRAEAQELAARRKAYASDMNLLQQALAADDLVRAQQLLNRQRPQPGQPDLRGWEWRYFWQFCQSDVSFTLCRLSNSITSVSFSRDGRYLAAGTYAGDLTVWEMPNQRLIFRRAAAREFPSRLAFAPTGHLLAFYETAEKEDRVVLWDCQENRELRRLRLSAPLRELAFSSDGRLFTADFSPFNNVTIWDVSHGTALDRFTARLAAYEMGTVFNVTKNGTRFVHARAGEAHTVGLVQTRDGTNSSFRVAAELTTALAFSPDGRTLVTGGGYAEGTIRLWDVESGQSVGTLEGHRSWVSSLKFLPDGRTLASASADGTIRLWDLGSRTPLRTLRGNEGELWTLEVSPDGGWIASGCKNGAVSFWNLTASTNRPCTFRTLAMDRSGAWEFSSDGKTLGAINGGGLKLYHLASLQLIGEPALGLNLSSFGFSPDMHWLVAGDKTGSLAVWDLSGRRMVTNFVAHPGRFALSRASFLGDGRRLLTYAADGTVQEWDASTWTERRHWQVPLEPYPNVAIPASANLFATASPEGLFELISVTNPEMRRHFAGQNRIVAIDLSRDGSTLAAASENGTVELWDIQCLRRLALMHGVLLGYHSVAISPDGQRIAAGSNGQEALKVWEFSSHEEVATLPGDGSLFCDAKFDPEGNTIGARNWSGVLHLWFAPSWKQVEAAEAARSRF